MPYATVQDLIDRYGQTEIARLTAARGGPVAVDAVRVERALTEAAALAESYLPRRYTLPLASVPAVLAGKVCALARHALYQGEDRIPTDQVKAGHDDALAWLRDVAAGKAELGLDPAGRPAAPEADAAGARFAGGARVMTANLYKY